MSIGPANLRNDMYRWDTNSLSWVVWDGSLSVGSLTIGTVDQGIPAAGASAWPVVVTDTADALVRAGDAGNNALRVNVVAGALGGGAVTVADGADVAEGATTDAAVSTDTTGTLSAKVRGIVKLLASVITAGKVTTDGSGATQPVSGTFWQATQPVSAATLPLPSGAATATLQTQPGVDIGDVTVNNAAGAAAVNIQDGGNVITVDGAVSVTEPVTANAGTDLNTSLLALENDGNLAAIAGKDFATQVTLALVETNTESLTTRTGADATDVAGPMVQAVGDDGSTLLPSIVSPLRLDALGRLLTSGEVDDALWVAEDLVPFFNQNADAQFFDLSW